MLLRRVVFAASCALCLVLAAGNHWRPAVHASDGFPPISPEELKMTSEPLAPGAPAVILYRQVDRDDNGHTSHEDNYIRIKVLTDEGRQRANVELPFSKERENVVAIRGRTVKPDGSEVPFDGTVFEKSLVKGRGLHYLAKTFTLPDVEVGSIIEYRWTYDLSEKYIFDSHWIRREPEMPPRDGVAGFMIVSLFPPGGVLNGFANWNEMGRWYVNLVGGRVEASPEIKQQVAALTASKTTALEKMQTLATFVQRDVRYVGIELGIGGWQPHAAADVFSHRYGDCKDKATLVRSMLHEIGIDSYHVVIYTERGAVTPSTPAHSGFNHAILAIRLPEGLSDPSLIATVQHPKLGKLLFFDPTNELIPFGQIPGYLQANYGLLVTPDGGELIELPQQPSSMNSIRRTAQLILDKNGTLRGDVEELRLGQRASSERWRLRNVSKDADRIKPIEELLAGSLGSFQITRASLLNVQQTDRPFGFNYSFESPNYAKNAGDLLLVRPRVIGMKGSGFLKTKEPRKFPIEFEEPAQDTDSFEITIPPGYVVDDVPPPVDADYGFASYHSKTVVNGNIVDYTRTFEVKELSVPVNKAEDLKKFYRIIAGDERNTVVLKPSP